jgi:sporulation protein YlmC with PRC-barrel domain
MILTTGMLAEAIDGPCGKVADLVVNPITWKVTHIVIEPAHHHDRSRLIPIAAIASTDEVVILSLSLAQVSAAPPVEAMDFVPLESWPESGEWDPDVQRVLTWPYYPYYGGSAMLGYPYGYGTGLLWGDAPMVTTTYDRIPKDTVEIRRKSEVETSDGHKVGHVDGFAVDESGKITHLILEHGHLWGHKDISIPLADIEAVRPDYVRLKVAKDVIGDYPSVPFSRHTLAV